jgi:hypothetical protein
MKSKLIKAEANGREYPCLVIDGQAGDGSCPTVFLKPDRFTSVVVTVGYLGERMDWQVGTVIDARTKKVQDDHGLDDGEGIHEDLPLFDGKIVLEN